jgi:hypothetical protein
MSKQNVNGTLRTNGLVSTLNRVLFNWIAHETSEHRSGLKSHLLNLVERDGKHWRRGLADPVVDSRTNTQANPRLPTLVRPSVATLSRIFSGQRQGHAKELVGLCPPSFCSRRTASTASIVSRAGNPRRTKTVYPSQSPLYSLQAIFLSDCAVQKRVLQSSQTRILKVTANQESQLESRRCLPPSIENVSHQRCDGTL